MNDQPVNLNKKRKARDRALHKKLADENAVKFGRTKAQKQLEDRQSQNAVTHLDGHKRSE